MKLKLIALVLVFFFSLNVHASEVTGNLSSAGVNTPTSGGSSEVSGTFGGGSSSGSSQGNSGSINGTVTGGSSGTAASSGGSSGGSFGGSSRGSQVAVVPTGSVLGASTQDTDSSGVITSNGARNLTGEVAVNSGVDETSTSSEDDQQVAIKDQQDTSQTASVFGSGIGFGAWYWWLLLLIVLGIIVYYLYSRHRDRDNRYRD